MSLLLNNRKLSEYDMLMQRLGPALVRLTSRHQLTSRESEMVALIALYGLSNREIAERCAISEKTVKNHIANIMHKLGIQSMRKVQSILLCHVLQLSRL